MLCVLEVVREVNDIRCVLGVVCEVNKKKCVSRIWFPVVELMLQIRT
jgi:hypothetical protein